jgi:hypothetical protein
VVSFVTISEIIKGVLVADRSQPARGEATKGQETWCAEKLVICLSLKPPANDQLVRLMPAVDQDTSNLRLSNGFV